MVTPTFPLRARVPGVTSAAMAELDGRPVAWFRVDPSHRRGALTEQAGQTIAAAAHAALEAKLPLVGVIASSGADVHDGVAALHGWGQAARAIAACSGVVPVALAVTGPAVSGPALLLGLADLVAMTDDAYAFVSGPGMVAGFTGVHLTNQALGGAAVHARASGLACFVAPDEHGALDVLGVALSYLPPHVDEAAPRYATDDPVDRADPALRGMVPPTATGSYDVRDVVRAVVDDHELVELRPRFAPNIVTALAAVGGQPVGVVANQPLALAGTLDIPASQKGARFVAMCDAFNLPILTFVDTPGFFPGKDLEWRGMIRHGAQLAFAYAEATVPRVAVILRKAYGGAYIVMDCRTMGNDVCFAWPTAEIAVMGAKGAVQILHRREDEATRLEREQEYAVGLLNPYVAAERGLVDAVIDPAETRPLVAAALEVLATKREVLRGRAHGNTPL